jgi:hypothetical protein
MTPVVVELRRRNGDSSRGQATMSRQSEAVKLTKAIGLIVGSVICGALSIFIPIAHFVLPWAIPLVGFGLAFYLIGSKGSLSDVRIVCPACHEPGTVPGGEVEDPMWRKCPACGEPFTVNVVAE